MFAEAPARMSLEEFLAWEQLQNEKHELIDGVPVPRRVRKGASEPVILPDGTTMMAGGTLKHHRIALNIVHHLRIRLAGGPCQPLGSDVLVPSPTGRARYPDVHVHCVDYPDDLALTAPEPSVLFEVLSPSNTMKQQMELLDDYQAITSVQQIVLVDGRRPFVLDSRRGELGWRRAELDGLEAVLELPAIGTELPFTEIYERVSFGA